MIEKKVSFFIGQMLVKKSLIFYYSLLMKKSHELT